MGYVAVKGGASAIENALKYVEHERIKGGSRPLDAGQIADQLHLAVDRVMGEGSLYAPSSPRSRSSRRPATRSRRPSWSGRTGPPGRD